MQLAAPFEGVDAARVFTEGGERVHVPTDGRWAGFTVRRADPSGGEDVEVTVRFRASLEKPGRKDWTVRPLQIDQATPASAGEEETLRRELIRAVKAARAEDAEGTDRILAIERRETLARVLAQIQAAERRLSELYARRDELTE